MDTLIHNERKMLKEFNDYLTDYEVTIKSDL